MSAVAVRARCSRSGVPAQERHAAAGFGISLGSAHAHVHAVIGHLAGLALGLTAALRSSDARYALLDRTLAECDPTGDGRADYSGKHRRHGANQQVVTAPDGTRVWISPALPGQGHDLAAARRHRIIATASAWASRSDPPHGPLQPKPDHVNRQSHPHTRDSPLNKLTDQITIYLESHRS